MSCFPSAYLRDKLLDKCLNNTDFTTPTAWYLALYTEDPLIDDSGDEVTGGSYARQAAGFAAASAGLSASDVSASFTALPTAIITHYAIHDHVSAGNMLFFGALPSPIAANSGDSVTVGSGGISISISGS